VSACNPEKSLVLFRSDKLGDEIMEIQELLPYIVIPIFFLVGLYLVGYGLNQLSLGIKSWNWPYVSGTIVRSRLVASKGSEGDVTYHSDIKYQYWVYGRSFTSTKICFGDGSGGSREAVERMVEKFDVGKSVSVYFYPINPRIAVLEQGLQTGIFWAIVSGIICVGISITYANH
jgi:hypothetical protein